MTIGLVVITVARHISYSLVNREVGTLGEGGTSLSMRLNVQKLFFLKVNVQKLLPWPGVELQASCIQG